MRTERYKLIHFYGKGGVRAQEENNYQNTPGTREYNSFLWMSRSGYVENDPDIDYMELYDLKKDPHELNNIYGKPGTEKITKELQQLLDNYRQQLQVDEY